MGKASRLTSINNPNCGLSNTNILFKVVIALDVITTLRSNTIVNQSINRQLKTLINQ